MAVIFLAKKTQANKGNELQFIGGIAALVTTEKSRCPSTSCMEIAMHLCVNKNATGRIQNH
jgi:hypothetical protein